MNAAALATPLAAFSAGLITSLHCAVMCGPLGCVLLGGGSGKSAGELRAAAALYHGSRVAAYSVIGGILGASGRTAAGIFNTPISRVLPWAFALLFLFIALDLDRYAPRPAFVSRLLLRLNLRAGPSHPRRTAAVLGFATPFLPCGPLYLVFGVALVSGSWFAGTTLLAAFALGTIPLYALAQIGAMQFQGSFSPAAIRWTRRVFAFASALLIGGRALVNDGSLLAPVRCLLCH